MTKTCTMCRKSLPFSAFNRDARYSADGPAGYGSRCRPCQSAYRKAWGERNAEHLAGSKSAYYRANRDRQQAWGDDHRARKRGVRMAVSPKDRQRLLATYAECCAYCGAANGAVPGRRGRVTLDHLMPLARGGEHSVENLIPCCGACNGAKKERTPLEWFLAMLGNTKGHRRLELLARHQPTN